MNDIKHLYNINPDLKDYVDRYAIKHDLPTEMALDHLMVRIAADNYINDTKIQKEEK